MRQTGIIILMFLAVASARADDCDLARCPIRFAILGDRTGGHVDHIFDSVVVEVERLRPDFVMTVGDMIEGYASDTAVYAEEWREFQKIVAPLTMPIHYTPGNHDITNDVGLAPFRKYVGEPVYSFDYRGLHIAVLDNSRLESTDGWPQEQLDWLTADLKAHQDAAYTMVFFHKPFWYNTVFQGRPDKLHDICKEYGVDAVVCGHMHDYFSGTYDGIKYTTIGSSGAEMAPDTAYVSYHYAWVTVDGQGIHVTPVRHDSAEPWDYVTTDEFFFKNAASLGGITMAAPLGLSDAMSPEDSTVTLMVHNLSTTAALKDTLRWDVPAGWTISPAALEVAAAPGDSSRVNFRIRETGKPYPLPVARMRIPYSAERSYQASRTLRVARRAEAFRVDHAPVIDGRPTETCWREPQVYLFDWDGSPSKTEPTEFYFAYDDSDLYLAARCLDNEPDSIRADMTGRDASVYTEDCVGYFLQPDVNAPLAYQIYVNPRGTVFDQKLQSEADGYFSGDQSWNGEYEVAAVRDDQGWSMEMRIPVAQFGDDKPGAAEWGLSFRRKQPRLGTGDWQLREGYDPSAYGRLAWRP